jgi:hypothetical protein
MLRRYDCLYPFLHSSIEGKHVTNVFIAAFVIANVKNPYANCLNIRVSMDNSDQDAFACDGAIATITANMWILAPELLEEDY